MNSFSEHRVLETPDNARILVKICGTTSTEDAQMAARFGADLLGVVVDFPASPRHVSVENARAIFAESSIPVVAVTVNQTLDALLQLHETLQPFALQLHGDESPNLARQLVARNIRVWAACSGERGTARRRALEMTQAGAQAVLLDARKSDGATTIYGGTGERSDWNLARELAQNGAKVILAGGLNPQNVREAIEFVQPWMVDVISGVEARKGVKNESKVRDFIGNARNEYSITNSKREQKAENINEIKR